MIHQANKLIVDRIVKKLKLPLEKTPYDLQEFGNLGGCSIPMLMTYNLKDELAEKPLTLFMLCIRFRSYLGYYGIKNKKDDCRTY